MGNVALNQIGVTPDYITPGRVTMQPLPLDAGLSLGLCATIFHTLVARRAGLRVHSSTLFHFCFSIIFSFIMCVGQTYMKGHGAWWVIMRCLSLFYSFSFYTFSFLSKPITTVLPPADVALLEPEIPCTVCWLCRLPRLFRHF